MATGLESKPLSITANTAKARLERFLFAAPIWQGFLTLAGLAAALMLFLDRSESNAAWLRPVTGILILIGAVASAVSIPFLLQRRAVGRTIALAVNYLGFVACLLAAFQSLGVFMVIDYIAAHFAAGLIPLVALLGGYLIGTLADRYPNNYRKEMLFRRLGQGIMAVSGIIFIILVQLIPWLISVVQNVNSFTKLALVLGAVGMGIFAWLFNRDSVAQTLHASNAQNESISGFLFLSPNLLGFLLFFAGPLLFSFYISFTDWDAFGTKNWVGLENYQRIFSVDVRPLQSIDQPVTEALNTQIYDELGRFNLFGQNFIVGARDKFFWLALRNTLLFCLMAVPLSVIPALFLANVLNSKIPGMKFFRALYFLPSIAAVVGVALIWKWLYDASIGYINYFITMAVTWLNSFAATPIVDPQIRWLSDGKTAMLAIVIMSAWQTMGFNTVLFLAGLQNVSQELYEAATVDGANAWNRFWKITLPLLAPTTFFVVTTTTIQALQIFEQVFIATNPPGGPNNATLTVVLYLYQNGFQWFKQGYASATAWVLFAIIFLVTRLQFQAQGKDEPA